MLPMKKGQSWLPNIFNDFLGNEWIAKENEAAPAINIMECEKRYRVEVAAPGMTKDDFTVEVKNDNHLVITMEKKCEKSEKVLVSDEKEPKKESKKMDDKEKEGCACTWEHKDKEDHNEGKYLRREFSSCHFRQTLILPDNVDKASISAKQENGVLTIIIPKKESFIEAQVGKKINIE